MRVTRVQVIGYRVAAQQLHREVRDVERLVVLDIGVQEAMGQPAALAFAARLASSVPVGPEALPIGPGRPLALAWTLRGAPHVHRRADLDRIARALWPLSEADAAARLNETGPSVERAGIPALEQFRLALSAMREVVTVPTAKGAASTEVTRRVPPPMRHDCRACKTRHISDSAMRATAPAAGLEMEPGTAPPVLLPRKRAKLPSGPDLDAVRALAHGYLTLLGPAGVGEFAGYLEARRADVAAAWPDGLVEVSIDGRRAWLPEERLAALRDAPKPELVRLLGPFDPYMQARDRELIVPDKAVQKQLWPVLGRPGVLFVDGEVAGVWRTKASGQKAVGQTSSRRTPAGQERTPAGQKRTPAGQKLTINVEAFAPLPPRVWREVEAEAARVAEVRGAADVAVTRVT